MLRGAVILALLAMIATWSIAMSAARGAQASDVDVIAVTANDDDTSTEIDGAPQANDDENDDAMRVVLWTVLAAGIAAGVGLVLYMVRVMLGRVQAPRAQQQDEAHH